MQVIFFLGSFTNFCIVRFVSLSELVKGWIYLKLGDHAFIIIISSSSSLYEYTAWQLSLLISISCQSILYVTLTKLPISSLYLVICLPCLLLPSLGCHSITQTVHLLFVRRMTCPVHITFFFYCGQDVFNFGLLPNPWCFIPIPPSYAKHYSLHSILGTWKFSFQDFCNNSGFRSIC